MGEAERVQVEYGQALLERIYRAKCILVGGSAINNRRVESSDRQHLPSSDVLTREAVSRVLGVVVRFEPVERRQR